MRAPDWELQEMKIGRDQNWRTPKEADGELRGIETEPTAPGCSQNPIVNIIGQKNISPTFRQFTINPETHSPINTHVVKPFRS
jgi:hypothetical protein